MGRMLGSAALALLLAFPAAAGHAQEPPVINVPRGDPEMAEAVAKGRAALGRFWQALEKPAPDESSFQLKVALPTGEGNSEHIWTDRIARQDGKIFGNINNVPKLLRNVRLGQRIEIPEPQISDWLYLRSGKIVGGYTIRVLLKRLPREEAAALRAKLADPD
jgi:uncharacterized protein YegJ (DUF2314 family)